MNKPKENSKWRSADGKEFVILHIVEQEDKTWIHYREDKSTKEFSCYLESFLARFSETP